MKELLFGWITKGQYNLSFLDSVIGTIEILIGIFITVVIVELIKEVIRKFEHKKEE